jgi:hypothetical protein
VDDYPLRSLKVLAFLEPTICREAVGSAIQGSRPGVQIVFGYPTAVHPEVVKLGFSC